MGFQPILGLKVDSTLTLTLGVSGPSGECDMSFREAWESIGRGQEAD